MRRKRGKVNRSTSLENKPFWMSLALVFLISIVVILLSSQENLTGNLGITQVSYAEKGMDMFFQVRDAPCVRDVRVQVIDTIKNGKIEFDKGNANFEGISVCKFSMNSLFEDSFGRLDLTLKIDEKDILNSGLNFHDVTVYFEGEEIETTFIKVERKLALYKISTNKMGEYVMGKKTFKKVQQPLKVEQEEDKKEMVNEVVEQPPQLEKPIPPIKEIPKPVQKGFIEKVSEFFKNFLGLKK
jgi:hypothetical protein